MAESLKAQLARIAEDIETEPNGGARLQRQIDILADEVTRLKNKRPKKKGS